MDYVQIDKTVRDSLQRNVVCRLLMGSHAHGIADEHSDVDYIYIYVDCEYDKTFHCESVGYQYKLDGVDENYQELRMFIRNVINGKNPSDFESLHGDFEFCGKLLDSDSRMFFNDIMKVLRSVRSYSLIKSYTGFAKKDAKHAKEMLETGCRYDARALRKKLSHLYRGNIIANDLLMDNKYQFGHSALMWTCKDKARKIKCAEYLTEIDQIERFIEEQEFLTQFIRDKAAVMLSSHELSRRASIESQMKIESRLKDFLISSDNHFIPVSYGHIRHQIWEYGPDFQYRKK